MNKWVPRGLEMFGDERGGDKNVSLGFKDMKNAEAQGKYFAELAKLLRDLNLRFLRARYPSKSAEDVELLLERVVRERSAVEGTSYDEILKMPHREFFRRRGEPAFRMVSVEGDPFTSVEDYIAHLAAVLPPAYLAIARHAFVPRPDPPRRLGRADRRAGGHEVAGPEAQERVGLSLRQGRDVGRRRDRPGGLAGRRRGRPRHGPRRYAFAERPLGPDPRCLPEPAFRFACRARWR